MIEMLQQLDNKTAVGVLARAALALGDEGNPAANPVLAGENELRAALFLDLRKRLGVGLDDFSSDVVERLGDILDEESDRLLGPVDEQSALYRLAQEGTLPSDLYEINIIRDIAAWHGVNFSLEKRLIETTVRSPDRQQHFGPIPRPDSPSLISIFAHNFQTKWPYKDFTMLVAGSRNGLNLDVHQAWRLYPAIFGNSLANKDLVDLLSLFADRYGWEIEVGGEKGHFIFLSDVPAQNTINIPFSGNGPTSVTVSQFSQSDNGSGSPRSALVVAINLLRYRSILEKMAVKSENIIDSFFHCNNIQKTMT